MASIFEKDGLNRIFLIYGRLDDMFMTKDLQKQGFRPFLNAYLKGLGYEQVVYYSGAKNVGKFVLDDESARLAINRNKGAQSQAQNREAGTQASASGAVSAPPGRSRIRNPNARREAAPPPESSAGRDAGPQPKKPETPETLVYSQPKITPFEFLDDARMMMRSAERRSAVVFTFMQDFLTDRGPMQPYLELVSHLWDEYSASGARNICIFLAPRLTCSDLARMFEHLENGETLKNKFFNRNGTVNRSVSLEVGLPGLDEIGYMLEYLRVMGEGERRAAFRQSEKKRLASTLLFLSREADRDENGLGSLDAVYRSVSSYMARHGKEIVPLTEEGLKEIYSRWKGADEPDPLEKLHTTRGWESVDKRIREILKGFELKSKASELKSEAPESEAPELRPKASELKKAAAVARPKLANERIEPIEDSASPRSIPHFILRGNPGVGKTTVARLIGRIFYDAGILRKGITVEAKRDDLVDVYVGGTAIRTTECVMSAQEGVLFIDDAYSLLQEGQEHNYPKEALDTLVPILTNPDRYRFCLIMAGYPAPMDKLLEMNPGLRSRFNSANILTIEDYRPDLLRDIFVGACRKRGYRFQGSGDGEDDPLDLDLFFTNLYNQRNRADFGNARDVTALAEEVMLQSGIRDEAGRCIVRSDFGAAQKFFERRDVSSIDDIYAELDGYVGLDFVKDIFKNVRLEILDARESAQRGVPVESAPDHYIFAGNPGTGKTTVGRMLGRFYHMMEVLGGSETLFVDASDIVGDHYGDSKTKVLDKIQRAIDRNCLLYIDEAYQIVDSGYAAETVGAMMTKMTENANDFKMVFGMYSNRVDEFLALNAGLSRRLRVVNFPDYNPEQLLEIFVRSVRTQGCTVSDEALDRVRLILTRMYDVRTESFGNAGEVKKLLTDMKRLRLARAEKMDPSDPLRYEYALADIPAAALATVESLVSPRSFEEIMGELNEQIGLSDLKDVILQKQEELLYARSIGEGVDDIVPGYYFFVGGPGTGKSTSARLFAECLHQLGIVRTNNFYACTAKDLIGQYVGETDKKTWNLLKKATNGVLFIDEAYSLSSADEPSGGSFRKEALDQIVAFLDDPENRKRCCIIFAGYLKDMQGLYRSNAGMRSRVEEVHFKDYTTEETYEIFALFCRKNGYSVAPGVRERYLPAFERLKELEYFANGRTARTIFEKTATRMKRRVIRQSDLSEEMKKTILPEDLLSPEEMEAAVSSR
ncbi:MAG: AAA family ATPase [Synergistaceae bacterium]|jgi:SpoVK/Ycf46/Vps4 family AAA+-type ATPase|nr:AAA family ATPase [Synergistaceae bacterium]